jgi:hypothetical protein
MSPYTILEWMLDPSNKIPQTDDFQILEQHRQRIAEAHHMLPTHPDITAAIERFVNSLEYTPPRTIVIEYEEQGHRDDWYSTAKKLSTVYWDRLALFLEQKRGRRPDDILHIGAEADRVAQNLANPASSEAARRGLVVGHVQSGKTSNMTAVMAKAADAGYKCIIVLAGVLDTLRQQTQLRFDQELTGGRLETWQENWKDLDRVLIKPRDAGWHQFTHCVPHTPREGDVKYNTYIPDIINKAKEPILCVTKKNPKRLEHLLRILRATNLVENGKFTLPTLVIDDESDQATINIRAHRDEIASTNGAIRELLKFLRVSTYVGYTATPFANVLIEAGEDDRVYGHDLFPEHFIVTLDARPSYLGLRELFGVIDPTDADRDEPGLPVIVSIPPEETELFSGRKKTKSSAVIPEETTLYKALLSFILSCAVRVTRGQSGEDMSMLIHPSSYTAIQNMIATPTQATIKELQATALDDSKWRGFIQKLEQLYQTDFVPRHKATVSALEGVPRLPVFGEIIIHAREVVMALELKVLHSSSEDFLQYFDRRHPKRYVIIGGNKLSRGLTLEGLSISYFVRSSRQYDTMMQMGRWFGHRRSYVDVTRIFMPVEAQIAFSQLAFVELDLREQFREYMINRMKPSEMPPKIVKLRNLAITAANRIGAGTTVAIDFSDRIVQQTIFEIDRPQSIKKRNDQILQFLSALGAPAPGKNRSGHQRRGSWIWENKVSTEDILKQFAPIELGNIDKELLFPFLREKMKGKKWYVAIAGKQDGSSLGKQRFGDIECELVTVNRKLKQFDIYSIRSVHSKGEFDDIILPFITSKGDRREEVGIMEIYLINPDETVLWSTPEVKSPPSIYLAERPKFIAAVAFIIPPMASGAVRIGIKSSTPSHAIEDEEGEVLSDE